MAARKYPLVLGRFNEDGITIAERINVGFAVNAPQGLVVPVVKDAADKTLAEIGREETLLTDKARDNKLTLEEIEGETIALSNLGAYGIGSFLGIIPPPASMILSVGNVIPTVVCRDGEMEARKIVSLSVAADRRILGEIYTAEFLNYIKDRLQNPQQVI